MNPTRTTSSLRERHAGEQRTADAPARSTSRRETVRPMLPSGVPGLAGTCGGRTRSWPAPPSGPHRSSCALGDRLRARPAADGQVALRLERVLGDRVRLEVGARLGRSSSSREGAPSPGRPRSSGGWGRARACLPWSRRRPLTQASERAMNGSSGATLFCAQQKSGSRAMTSAPCSQRKSSRANVGPRQLDAQPELPHEPRPGRRCVSSKRKPVSMTTTGRCGATRLQR